MHYRGSIGKYIYHLKSIRTPAHKIRTYSVYKKAVHEYNSDMALTGDWQTRLETAASTFKVTVGTKLKGYIQNIETFNSLAVTCFTEKQLQCLFKTNYRDRILHIDATGSLVKVADQQNKQKVIQYKRILNYYCLVNNLSLIGKADSSFQLGKHFYL